MRKLLLIVIAFCAFNTILHAQISKGSLLLGGGLGFSDDKGKGDYQPEDRTGYSIRPEIGIAIKENTVAGMRLLYRQNKADYSNAFQSDTKEVSYGAGVFMRKYLTLGKGFYFFGEGEFNYTHSTLEYYNSPMSLPEKSWSLNIDMAPGLSYAVNKKFHLETSLGSLVGLSYSKRKKEGTDGIEQNHAKARYFSIDTNASNLSMATIGFRIFLSK